ALPALPTPRHGMAVATSGSSLYAIGGALAPTHAKSTRTAEALDFGGTPAATTTKPQGGLAWRSIHPAPTPRQQLAAAADQSTIWLMGGLTSGTTATAKTEG